VIRRISNIFLPILEIIYDTRRDPPIQEYASADLQIQPLNDTIYDDPEHTWDEYIQS
jgi:hypothetical protein